LIELAKALGQLLDRFFERRTPTPTWTAQWILEGTVRGTAWVGRAMQTLGRTQKVNFGKKSVLLYALRS
jgi:hypothetical protein